MSERISRRQFIASTLAFSLPLAFELDLVGLNMLAKDAKALGSWISEIPPAKKEDVRPRPFPGWLETQKIHQNRPAFLNTTTGHEEWLRHFFNTDPLIRAVTKKAFEELFSPKNNVQNEKMGDVLKRYIGYAQEQATGQDSVHLAIIALAIVHSPYFSIKDIRNLGIEVDHGDIPDYTSIFWVTKTQNKLPHMFPAPLSDCRSPRDVLARCLGLDRAVHTAQHLFVTYEYLYALAHNLQEKDRIPRGIKLVLRAGRTNEEKAEALSFWAGRFWELKESRQEIFGNSPLPTDPKEFASGVDEYGIIPTGFFDKMVVNDLRANELGSRAGILLAKNIEAAIGLLNDSSIYQVHENNTVDFYASILGW